MIIPRTASTLLVGILVAGYLIDHLRADDSATSSAPDSARGVVMLIPTRGNEVAGTLLLTQLEEHLHVQGEVVGLTPGRHGIHVYQYGDLRDPQGKATGGHYNPDGNAHGGPDDEQRCAGDLGNIEADTDGIAVVDIEAKGLKLPLILGRSIVVHAGEDDLTTQPRGNSGPRVAVGVIGRAQRE